MDRREVAIYIDKAMLVARAVAVWTDDLPRSLIPSPEVNVAWGKSNSVKTPFASMMPWHVTLLQTAPVNWLRLLKPSRKAEPGERQTG